MIETSGPAWEVTPPRKPVYDHTDAARATIMWPLPYGIMVLIEGPTPLAGRYSEWP